MSDEIKDNHQNKSKNQANFPTVSLPGTESGDTIQETQIGPYKLTKMLCEGGFGYVYLAEQEKPIKRLVALKIIKPGMDSRRVISRFEAERQALALLNHPNIAKVFDAGSTDQGRPYFVMEYVEGTPITDYCDKKKLSIKERLELFINVCQAIHHAHQKGIIHRDIKPSNILVSEEDGQAVPKVIDFGIAKAISQNLTEQTIFTEQGQLIGTPEYMSPEQADLGNQDIDTLTDVYSLGVVLYELLTGALPFEPQTLRQAAFREIQRIICEQEPPKPSTRISSETENAKEIADNRQTAIRTLQKQLHNELEWIPLMALRKERERRYQSAVDLAEDVQNYLDGNPLVAGPESSVYRFKKFVKKRKGLVAAVITVTSILVACLIIVSFSWVKTAESERNAIVAQQETQAALNKAKREEKLNKSKNYVSGIHLAEIALNNDNYSLATQILDGCQEDLRNWEWYFLDDISHYLAKCKRTLKFYQAPDSYYDCLSEFWKSIAILDMADHSLPHQQICSWIETGELQFPNINEYDRNLMENAPHVVFENTPRIISDQIYQNPPRRINQYFIYNNGIETDKQISSIKYYLHELESPLRILDNDNIKISSVGFSKDNNYLLLHDGETNLTIWNIETEQIDSKFQTFKLNNSESFCVSPVDNCVAIASINGICVRDFNGNILYQLNGQLNIPEKDFQAVIQGLTWSPDGRSLAFYISNPNKEKTNTITTIGIWDVKKGFHKIPIKKDSSHGPTLLFSPDNNQLAGIIVLKENANLSSYIIIWDVHTAKELDRINCDIFNKTISPDWTVYACMFDNCKIKINDFRTGKTKFVLDNNKKGMFISLSFSKNGTRLISSSKDGMTIWDLITGQEVFGLSCTEPSNEDLTTLSQQIIALAPIDTPYTPKVAASFNKEIFGFQNSKMISATFSLDNKYLALWGNAIGDGEKILLLKAQDTNKDVKEPEPLTTISLLELLE